MEKIIDPEELEKITLKILLLKINELVDKVNDIEKGVDVLNQNAPNPMKTVNE